MPDVLKDKATKDYDYISRYTNVPYYYHTIDNKYIYGTTSWLNKITEIVAHKVTPRDTLDSLALQYYGRPDYYWVIADYNRITDCFIKLSDYFDIIEIPSIGKISFEAN